jgi:hypothetical protein
MTSLSTEALRSIGIVAKTIPQIHEQPAQKLARLESFRAYAEREANRYDAMIGVEDSADYVNAIEEDIETLRQAMERLEKEHARWTGKRHGRAV